MSELKRKQKAENPILKFIRKIDFIRLIIILLTTCAISDFFMFFFNVITVTMTYGLLKIWQPVVTNADKIGLGTFYLILAHSIYEKRKDHLL